MQRYMSKCPKPYMQIVRANVDRDFATLVKQRPVSQWKETLAMLATYTGTVSCCRASYQLHIMTTLGHASFMCSTNVQYTLNGFL